MPDKEILENDNNPQSDCNATSLEPEDMSLLWVDEKGKLIEPIFADYFISLHPMKCFHDRLFTVDGMIDDEAVLKGEIYSMIRSYVTSNVARKIENVLQIIKLSCTSEPPEIRTDRIHVANGTYFLDG